MKIVLRIGDSVRIDDTTEGVVTAITLDDDGEPFMVTIMETERRFHNIPIGSIEPRRLDS